MMFALDYLVDYYRVQTIELATGERYDTSDRDKGIPPEDMHGTSVHGVMSADHTLLATLYRNPGDDEEPAFVHVLDLRPVGRTARICPRRSGPDRPGPTRSSSPRRATLLVAANQAGRLAEIHIDGRADAGGRNDSGRVHRDGTIAPPSAVFTAMPGFAYLLGEVPQ